MNRSSPNLPRLLSLCAVALVLCCRPLHAEIITEAVSLKHVDVQGMDCEALSRLLEGVYQTTLNAGVKNFIPYSLLLIKEARDALAADDAARAEVLSAYARKLSPDLPAVYAVEGRVQFHKNKLFVHRLVQGHARAFMKSFNEIATLSYLCASNLMVIIGTFLLSFACYSMLSVWKYGRVAVHDIRHTIAGSIPSRALAGFIALAFFLPLFLNFTIFWLFTFWLVLLYNYHTRAEQWVIAGLFVVMAAMPLLFSALGFSLFMPQSDRVRLLWKSNYGFWGRADIEQLEHYNVKRPRDEDILLTLGLVHKKDKNYRTAGSFYEKLLDLNPSSYKGYVNMGNVLFATGQWEEAVQHYKRAISLAPHASGAAHFNLGRAYQQKFMFKEAEQELIAARHMDAARVGRCFTIYSENQNRLLIDETISQRRLWNLGFFLYRRQADLPRQLWDLVFLGVSMPYAPVVFLGGVFLCVVLTRKERFRIAKKCSVCGTTLCKRCQGSMTGDVTCTQCMNLFKKTEAVDYRLKEAKTADIRRYLRRQRNTGVVLSLLSPGAGCIWKGRPVRGVILLLLQSALVLKIVSICMFRAPWVFTQASGGVGLWVYGAGLLVLWAWASRAALAQEDKALSGHVLLQDLSRQTVAP